MTTGNANNLRSFLILAITAILLTAVAVTVRTYRSFPIEDKEYIMNRQDIGLTLLDRDGTPFYSFERPLVRKYVPLTDIPKHTSAALIAAEDKNFYHHWGISPSGILRSSWLNFKNKSISYGGSTITQQLVKNSYFSPRKSFVRKYQEAILSFKIERHYSKDDILEMYLNSAYFGEGAIGIASASERYFNKPVSKLTIAESAIIIGTLPAPSELSPLAENRKQSLARQQYVLKRLWEDNYISRDTYKKAMSQKLKFTSPAPTVNNHGLHFAMMIRKNLFKKYGEKNIIRSHLRVTTTLDLDLQKRAEQLLEKHIQTLATENASNGAIVIIDPPTGEIRAMVGSRNWHYPGFGTVNMATSPRQTGSAFKPVVYAAAFEQQSVTPSSVLLDQPKTYGKNYRPQNYDGRFRGKVLARYALANSLNIPAVEIVNLIGAPQVVRAAEKMGISSLPEDAQEHLSIALGAEPISLLELTNTYAEFANNGIKSGPIGIIYIENKYKQKIYEAEQQHEQAIDPRAAYLVNSILADNPTRAAVFGRTLEIPGHTVAAKTGTTQNYKDAWTIGYTPQIAVGVWIGNNDNTPMRNLPGARGAAPLWKEIMQNELAKLPPVEFQQPPGITKVKVCNGSGLLMPEGSTGGYTEYFITGTQPIKHCVISTPTPSPNPEEEKSPKENPASPEKPKPQPPPKPAN